MGGKASGKISVTDYYMSLHYGVCVASEGLELLEVKVQEKSIWTGQLGADRGLEFIGRPNLFGGIKKAGGVRGLMHWLPGGMTQVLPTGLTRRLGLPRRNCQGYRNIASVFFTGTRAFANTPPTDGWDDWVPTSSDGKLGFMWGSNNPYIPKIWFRLRRPPLGLNPAKAMMPADPTKPAGPQAANGAHIIYECLTNRSWGAGMSPARLDHASFETAASTLYNEGLGLAGIWARQSDIEDFVNEILDHINATLFLHPRTGLLTLKLLREDYDLATLRRVTPSNARMVKFGRKMWGETANEIVVTWTNPANEKEETLSYQDLANVAIQGGIVSSPRNYHLLRSARMAMAAAQRELAASAYPLVNCEVEVDRSAWSAVAGEVVILEWPEYGIGQLVCRVMNANYGEADSDRIRLSLLEDIWGVPLGEFSGTQPPPPADVDDPQPVAIRHLMTAPAMLAASAMGLNDPQGIEYPDAIVVILAAPTQASGSLHLWSDVTLPSGTVEPGEISLLNFTGSARLDQSMLPRPTSVLPPLYDETDFDVQDGDFLLIGSGADHETEIAVVTGVDETGVHINRGVLDTIPRSWPAGTRLWRVRITSRQYDSIVRADGEAVTYRLLPQTSGGTLDYADAPDETFTPSGRATMPLRPADVRVRGRQWGPVGTQADTDLTITWANRNRIVEASVALPWTAASSGVEPGQTTTVEVLSNAGAVLATYDGLTGTSLTIPITDFGAETTGRIRVSSELDGIRSLQAYEIEVWPGATFAYGYGGSYGANYGG